MKWPNRIHLKLLELAKKLNRLEDKYPILNAFISPGEIDMWLFSLIILGILGLLTALVNLF